MARKGKRAGIARHRVGLLALIVALIAGCSQGGERIVPIDRTAPPAVAPPSVASPSVAPPAVAADERAEADAPQHPAPRQTAGALLRAYKAERRLELWVDGALLHTFDIALGFSPVGHKESEGDGRTPEGEYYICTRNDRSRYYLSLGISYPGAQDAERGLAQGQIDREQYDAICDAMDAGTRPPWDTPLGGEIMIHGNGAGSDWTAGCIAVEDADMDILWEAVALGTTLLIDP